jgi:hypothetical protein
MVKSEKRQLKCALPLLKALSRMNDEERVCTLQHLTDDALQIVYGCIQNCVYNKDLPKQFKNQIRKALSNKKHILEHLSDPGKPPKRRKHLLKQVGSGGLQMILEATIPLLEAFLGQLPT